MRKNPLIRFNRKKGAHLGGLTIVSNNDSIIDLPETDCIIEHNEFISGRVVRVGKIERLFMRLHLLPRADFGVIAKPADRAVLLVKPIPPIEDLDLP